LPTLKGPPVAPSSGSPVPSISVDGEAEDYVKPDLAILSLGAVDDRPTAADAAVENAKLSNNIVAMVKKFGIDPQDIRAESLNLSPVYRNKSIPKTNDVVVEQIFVGYRAFTMYRVYIHNVDEAPRIARQIVESGANIYRGLTFLAKDRDMRFDTLRAKAVANALERATLYASNASLKLGNIVQIWQQGDQLSGHSDKDLPTGKGATAEAELSVPTKADLEAFHARVRVTWELAPQSPPACEADKDRK
jgi:uncharacterized protein YggE